MPGKTWVVALAAVALGGCTATFVDPRVPAGQERTVWNSFFIGGLVGHAEVDVRDVCPSGRAREVQTGENVLTLGATVLTLGVYAPRRVRIVCAKVPAP